MLRSVFGNVVFSANSLSESPWYWGLSSGTKQQTISYWFPVIYLQKYTCRCKRAARLANLCRLCSSTNQDCSNSLCRRSTGIGSVKYCLCTWCIYDWSLFFCFPVGTLSIHKVCGLRRLLDLRGDIPSFVHISEVKLHDVNALDMIIPEASFFYVMDPISTWYFNRTRISAFKQDIIFLANYALVIEVNKKWKTQQPENLI